MGRTKRHFIKAKDFIKIYQRLPQILQLALKDELTKKPEFEKIEFEKNEIYLINKQPVLVKSYEEKIFPTLHFSEALKLLPKVIVDQGAIPYICRGADVMRPGIVRIDGDFQPSSLVVVVDEKHLKPIAVGLSKYSSMEINILRSGKVVENVHYVGDKLWKFLSNLKF